MAKIKVSEKYLTKLFKKIMDQNKTIDGLREQLDIKKTSWVEPAAAQFRSRVKRAVEESQEKPEIKSVGFYRLPHEVQSGVDRVKHAELLILQLPKDHDGRNTWLLNYGKGIEAQAIRLNRTFSRDVSVSEPEDLSLNAKTHRADWLRGLAYLIEYEKDLDSKNFWKNERRALIRFLDWFERSQS